MPPSGFTPKQAENIPDFLFSCWKSLREEGTNLNLTPSEALLREVQNISAMFDELRAPSLVESTLSLIRHYYSLVATTRPKTYEDAEDAAERVCTSLCCDLSDIHVPDASDIQGKGLSGEPGHQPDCSK